MSLRDDTIRESVVEKYLVSQLRLVRQAPPYPKIVVKKIGGPGWRGWPDRMVLFEKGQEFSDLLGLLPTGAPACAHWLEVKRPKDGRFEPLQLRNHKMLRVMGFVVRVVNTQELVDGYIADLLRYGPHKIPLI